MIFEGSRYVSHDIYYDTDLDVSYLELRSDFKSSDDLVYYQFQVGDRLDILAEQFYGDSQYGWLILKANPQYMSELDIEVGDVLIIPQLGDEIYE